MSKVIRVTSTFSTEAQVVWEKLQNFETLQHIARPMMTFSSAGHVNEISWVEGVDYRFKLRMFCLIPFGGTHAIHVERMDAALGIIQTQEKNDIVRVWNHRIELQPRGDKTLYTDIVEIDAGVLTFLVTLWSHVFYRHRQRRWRRILKEET